MKRNLVIFLSFICAVLLINEAAFGQALPDTLQLNELEVVSNRNAHSPAIRIATVDSISKRELGYLDLGELLAVSSPVYIKSYGRGSLATASIRGAGSNQSG